MGGWLVGGWLGGGPNVDVRVGVAVGEVSGPGLRDDEADGVGPIVPVGGTDGVSVTDGLGPGPTATDAGLRDARTTALVSTSNDTSAMPAQTGLASTQQIQPRRFAIQNLLAAPARAEATRVGSLLTRPTPASPD